MIKSASEGAIKKQPTSSDTATTSTLTNGSGSSKNVRGIIHLPVNEAVETIDQANQTYSEDYCTKEQEEYDYEKDRSNRLMVLACKQLNSYRFLA